MIMSIKWSYLVVLLILAGSFSYCSDKAKGKGIAYKTIFYARGYGRPSFDITRDELSYNAPIHKIISNQEDWVNLLAPLSQGDLYCFSKTDIDFKEYLVIFLDEFFSSMSWRFEIARITEYSDRVVVYLRKRPPPSYDFDAISGFTIIVKIPVTTKSIEFEYI